MRTVAVVGASLAGLRAVEELRTQGFDGRIAVIGEEPHQPYDRPPLSKAYLTGTCPAEGLRLADAADLDGLGAEWHLGVRADSLDPGTRSVRLSDGTEIVADGVVIATGGRARPLPAAEGLAGVHTLRTLDDAAALRADLDESSAGVVVIGAGWIGAEVASTCRTLGLPVTVVEAAPTPLARVLGPTMGAHCAALHTDHGADLRTGVGVASLTSTGFGPWKRVSGVVLDDGTHLPADVVVAGIGMLPNTEWLAGSGLPLDNGVLCDAGCVTAFPSVVAVGDVARYQGPDGPVRHEHWSNASEQPATAVRNLLAGTTIQEYRPSGYFWSDQYGTRLQVAGHPADADEVAVVDGSPSDRRFVAEYRREGAAVGVLAMNNPKQFGRLRRLLPSRVVPA
ncbi:NAD(P)/FAD-dependent oxidoreductase [Nocardiopsis sp. NRRL B-16309]|uniref:NAD(P)/FAD-dependent oxidoreductase n=1 Tax=Nocardiopsis sp. NRRL B-16309 TaxID=1519494 RepID=UPI0006AE0ED4|nr:FAD-dependent oxidoreductase [Nocardiopsis sp. NRRL B-16309]KOX16283.1 pyridine nucleotide-disulfide oxidoreductase [Nocardiopsis sp. NRRL B-16309]